MYDISKDNGPSWPTDTYYVASSNATTAVAVTDAPTEGEYIHIDDLFVSVDTEMNLIFQSLETLREGEEEPDEPTPFLKLYLYPNVPLQISFRNSLRCPIDSMGVEVLASVAGNIAIVTAFHSGV
jgi:hypothetical protein